MTVAYNSAPILEEYWKTFRSVPGLEWVVVDNCSADGSAATAEDLGANVIRLRRNVGFSAANNIGAKEGSGGYIGFANPDVTVDLYSLTQLARSLDTVGGIVGPQLLNPDGTPQPNGRGLPTLQNKIGNRLSESVDDSQRYNIIPAGKGLYRVAWLMGAAVCMSRSVFDEISGWNSKYFVYFEDAELGIRASERGLPVVLDASVNWVHGWDRAPTRHNYRARRLEIASALRFYRQYPRMLTNRMAAVRFAQIASALGSEVTIGGRS